MMYGKLLIFLTIIAYVLGDGVTVTFEVTQIEGKYVCKGYEKQGSQSYNGSASYIINGLLDSYEFSLVGDTNLTFTIRDSLGALECSDNPLKSSSRFGKIYCLSGFCAMVFSYSLNAGENVPVTIVDRNTQSTCKTTMPGSCLVNEDKAIIVYNESNITIIHGNSFYDLNLNQGNAMYKIRDAQDGDGVRAFTESINVVCESCESDTCRNCVVKSQGGSCELSIPGKCTKGEELVEIVYDHHQCAGMKISMLEYEICLRQWGNTFTGFVNFVGHEENQSVSVY